MHAEWGEISKDAAKSINAARAAGGRIVAIGTTSLRLMESGGKRGWPYLAVCGRDQHLHRTRISL